MKITSAQFMKGVVSDDPILGGKIPQIAFIGRSNVGKSSLINAITKKNDLARTSSSPGHTQQINLYLINNSFYLVDLPGYGFAKMSHEGRENLRELIYSYFFNSAYGQNKVVLIIDASVGPTEADLGMLFDFENHGKDIVVVASKADRIKKSEYVKQIRMIEEKIGNHPVIPFSSKTKVGIGAVIDAVFG